MKLTTLCKELEGLEKIKERIQASETEDIRIKIETKHWYGYSEPFIQSITDRITLPKRTIYTIVSALALECKQRLQEEAKKNENNT